MVRARSFRILSTFGVASVLAGSLGGCAALGLGAGQGTESDGIAAAFYPLAYVAEQVSGEDVALLTTPGAEPHDLELTVRETTTIAGAELVVYEHGFQPAVDNAIDEVADGRTVDAADVLDLRPTDEHADEHEDEHEDHAHEDGLDPHFWHDPLAMAELGQVIATELGELRPDQAEEYLDRAAELRDRMEALDRDFAEGLSSCERSTVVVSHDAFGYLEKYDLEFAPIAGLSPDAEPTPAHLSELQALARSEGITTVFAETLGSRKMAESLASDLGLTTAVLDPIEGVAEGSDDDYETLMRRNLAALQEANGC